jgi:hypothetical protein
MPPQLAPVPLLCAIAIRVTPAGIEAQNLRLEISL